MKNAWFLVLASGLAMVACSSDDEKTTSVASSVGGSAGSSSDVAGSSSVAGSSASGGESVSTGGTSSASGGASEIAGSSSTGGIASGGTSSVAGASSVEGGSSSVAGLSNGGVASVATGLFSCATKRVGTEEFVLAEIKHVPESSSIKTVTFWANCGASTSALSGWAPVCSDVSCENGCACQGYLPKGSSLQHNVYRGVYVWAVGSTGSSSAKCPNTYDPVIGCQGKEDLIQNGFTYVNGALMTSAQAVKNPQNTGYNYLYQVP